MAITDLGTLLENLQPILDEQDYVFCTVAVVPDSLNTLATFREGEGISLICQKEEAEASGLTYDGIFRKITLSVYSSLEAVGLTAAVSTALTEANISANVVAAYHHDHLFVPADKAAEAMGILKGLGDKSA
ncbi:MAG: transporter [Rickettsiales bacterium]|nr:transporter [Rickettsiales bacterium]